MTKLGKDKVEFQGEQVCRIMEQSVMVIVNERF